MSKTKHDNPRFSDTISAFLKLMDDVQRDYTYNSEQVNRIDKLTQDYLHSLELDGLDYKGRAKVATQLSKARQDRRAHKDMVVVLEPIVQFLDNDKGKTLLNLMRKCWARRGKQRVILRHGLIYPEF